jgi:hypothetical protein
LRVLSPGILAVTVDQQSAGGKHRIISRPAKNSPAVSEALAQGWSWSAPGGCHVVKPAGFTPEEIGRLENGVTTGGSTSTAAAGVAGNGSAWWTVPCC